MFANAASSPTVPSRNALRVLRQLALAGSTVGGFCTVAAVTYDVHRRVRVAEQIIENKRTLRTSAPNYDATASAKRLALMMETAEAGEFMGLDSLKNKRTLPQAEGDSQASSQSMLDDQEHSSRKGSRADISHDMSRYGPFSRSESTTMKHHTIDPADSAREAGQTKEDSNEAQPSPERKIALLIAKDEEIEAANVFLRYIHDLPYDSISFETREIARQLFAINCMKGNTFLARTLFERMEKLFTIDVHVWATMMHLLAKEGHIDSVGSVYQRHERSLTVPAHLLEVVLRSLLESRRVNLAKKLFYSRIKDDENCGLCGAFLDGLWRKTRNLDLIMAEFRTILDSLANMGRSPTEKLFNPLIKALIESGQFEDAEALVSDMPQKYDVKPGSRTYGLLLYAKSLACDWEGVFAGMREMHRLGLTRDERGFAYAFDRVFLEYYPVHTGREIFEFLTSCIHQFDLVPDKVLHQHILEALVEKGDSRLVSQITRMANERQWKTGIDQDHFLSILNARRTAMQDSPVGLWRVFQAAKKQYGQTATTRRLLGTGSASYSLERGVLMPIHRPAEETFSKSLTDLVHSKHIDNYVPLRKQMERHINGGRFERAIEAFQNARHSSYVLKPSHIRLAVVATILGHGRLGLKDAQLIIKSEYRVWMDVPKIRTNHPYPISPPIFFQQLLQLKDSVKETTILKMAIFEYYNLCRDTEHLTVKHHALASLSKRLISSKYNRRAINILTAVYRSTWRKTHGFDQVLHKMLIRAFAETDNLRGVWWCMLAVLSRPEPVLRDFHVEVQRWMPSLHKLCARLGKDESEINHNMKVLNQVSKALKRSMENDPYWVLKTPRAERKSEGRTKMVHRSAEEQNLLPPGGIRSMVRGFDEEMELDLLMNDKPHAQNDLKHVWSEEMLTTQSHYLPEDPQYPGHPWLGRRLAGHNFV